MRKWIVLLLCCYQLNALATVEQQLVFQKSVQRQRFIQLTHELRCLVCQNQDLADSQAPLALDLRDKIATAIRQGQSDEQIKSYLVARYGEFILYKPAVNRLTYILWLGPFVLLLLLLGSVFYLTRRRTVASLDERQQARAQELLQGEKP